MRGSWAIKGVVLEASCLVSGDVPEEEEKEKEIVMKARRSSRPDRGC